jgi:hypothetical protein
MAIFPVPAFTATLAPFPDLRRRIKTPTAQFLLAGRLWADCQKIRPAVLDLTETLFFILQLCLFFGLKPLLC